MRSNRATLGIGAIVVLILAVGFFAYRFTQYGQPSAPAPGQAAQVDQKPPNAYNSRP